MGEAYNIAESFPAIPAPDYDAFFGDGRRECIGLLPDDPASPHLASFSKVDDSLVVVKIIPHQDAENRKRYNNAAAADSLVLLLPQNPDGTRAYITASYPAIPATK